MKVTGKRYLDALSAGARDYVDARLGSISLKLERIDGDNHRSREYLRQAIIDVEKRVADKFEDRERAIAKAADVMDDRLDQMNAFRDQITSERRSYITREQLDVIIKGIMDQVDIVKHVMTLESGKDTGISKFWYVIVSIFTIFSGIAAVIVALNATGAFKSSGQ